MSCHIHRQLQVTVTYCVLYLQVTLLAEPVCDFGVEMNFKVLPWYNQDNILLQTYLYRCDFCLKRLFVYQKWKFTVLLIVLEPTVSRVSFKVCLYIHCVFNVPFSSD